MAASSGSRDASDGPHAISSVSSVFPSTSDAAPSSSAAADDAFGTFSAAERLSDPFGDVYGAEADFGDFVGGSSDAQETEETVAATGDASLMSFSPLKAPTEPPALLPSISGEIDPFADITGGLGAAAEAGEVAEVKQVPGGGLQAVMGPSTSTSSATSAILDLVWGNTSQDTETNLLSASSTSVGSASAASSRTASNPGVFLLPPPPSTKAASFPTAAARTPEASTGDLLSFSPVQASAPKDPFFGISNDVSETSAAPAFGNDELFTLTETPPMSTTSSSAPTSLHGSFASLHGDVKTPTISPTAPGSVDVTRDPFVERTTRSIGSLNSSFVGVGTMEDSARQTGVQASFSSVTSVAPDGSASPSSAPPSLRSSFKMADEFMGFASAHGESDDVDPFAEAGLAAPNEVPLAEALAAWNTSAESIDKSDEDKEINIGEQPKQDQGALSDTEQSEPSSSVIDPTVVAVVVDESSGNIVNDVVLTQSASTEAKPLDIWDHTDSSTTNTPDRIDEDVGNSVLKEQASTPVARESLSFETFTMPSDVVASVYEENVEASIADEFENEVHALGLQDSAFEDGECDSDDDDDRVASDNDVIWPADESSEQDQGDRFHSGHADSLAFLASATDEVAKATNETLSPRSALPNEESSLPSSSAFSTSFGAFIPAPTELLTNSENLSDDQVDNGTDTIEVQGIVVVGEDDFGDFGGFEAASDPTGSTVVIPDASPWGSFPSPTPAPVEDDDSAFGDFAEATSGIAQNSLTPAAENDGFAEFAQNTELVDDDDFGDFGDFTQSATAEGFSDFQQSSSEAFGDGDNGFGDFTPATTGAAASPLSTIPAPTFSKTELLTFFTDAFPVEDLSSSTLPETECPSDEKDTVVVQEPSTEFVQDVFRTMWDEYLVIVASTGHRPSSPDSTLSSSEGERVRLGRKTKRASKYLKYVLSEKIQEASRQNGIFPHGSERHQIYVGYAASGDAERMREALKELQDALFHSSVNEAMMRIAKQAALSAKAKIAEQAAQQQANSRGGSLFSTTRHLLSRGGSAGAAHGPGSSGNDNKADHAGADTPTGASVQKLARFSFTNSHDDASNGHRGASGDERGSEGSDHTGHSSGSDSEAVVGANDSRTRSLTLSGSGSSNGGLMKKFQDRFSFASSRHRPRFVSLRRKGQSGEEVRKMELNLDAISGGLDEVKWKCAMFLYDVEEVAHVAPSQISILSYPSKQPLTGKTDRSALTKLVKPDTIWTVDIGANNSDMLNEW